MLPSPSIKSMNEIWHLPPNELAAIFLPSKRLLQLSTDIRAALEHLTLNQYQLNPWNFALYDLPNPYSPSVPSNASILFSNLAAIDVLSSKNMQLRD